MNALSTQKISMLAEQPASFSMAARDIYPLICVRDPYFAFQRFDVDSETVTSAVAAEHPLVNEVGPIGGAEAGRHLAILGSCAAAMANPTRARHYYLARDAYIERTSAPVPPDATQLVARAKGSLLDKRTAQASCTMSAGGDHLWSLDLQYSVLSEALFTRLYGKFATEPDNVTPLQKINPYRSSLPFEILENDGNRLRGTLGVLRREFCAGHFTRFPCLPVAVLMNCLSQTAGAMLAVRAGIPNLKYTLECADVFATELAFAGTRIHLEGTFVANHRRGDQFHVRAVTESGTQIGGFVVVLKGHAS
jgi:3-hydroxymyristoyl/3-hydroxydecanoyl-(acyl carrier protein) dehydratase